MRSRLRQAANNILDQLRSDDEVTLLSFGERLRIEVPPTRDLGQVRQALSRLEPGWAAQSMTRDAIFLASGLVADREGHPLVVLLGDGGDNASLLTEQRSIELTPAVGIPIDVIASEPNYLHNFDMAYGRTPRIYFTRESGGREFQAGDAGLTSVLQQRLSDLRQQYILSFEPTIVRRDGWRKLRVRLRNARGTVHTRRGYFAAAAVLAK